MTKSAVVAKTPSAGKAQGARSVPRPPGTPEEVRNVVLVGRSGVGKTTLVEHLLARSGALTRVGSVAEGNTASDTDPVEIRQQRSVFLAACPLSWRGIVVNLLDTPGFGEFVGELRAGVRAADAALFVVSATDPVDETTVQLWQECAAAALPRVLVVTRLDMPRADFGATVAAARAAFGEVSSSSVVPLAEVTDDGAKVRSLLGASGADSADRAESADGRASLIEAVIAESEDEALLEEYLDGAELDEETLRRDLHAAVSRGNLYPAVPVSAGSGVGLAELLDLVVDALPSPAERPLPRAWTPVGADGPRLACDPEGPLAAEIVRTWSDQYAGRVSLVRVFSGTLRADLPLHVIGRGRAEFGHPDHDVDEKPPTVLTVTGEPADRIVAGNLCLVSRLVGAEIGDTLCAPDQQLVVLPWGLPVPAFPVAVTAASRNDEDHLAVALERLTIADPAVRIDRNAETGQLLLWCLGEAHADVVLSRLRAAGANVETEPVRVALHATFAASAEGHGRHVKQSGGHGQYAICVVTVEPLPRDAGVEFIDKVVGGAIPNQFIPSVEKGVRAQLVQGQAHAIPIVDVRVTLRDGKAHSVDSSDAAFQVAGALAIRDAATTAGLRILEPIEEVCVSVNGQYIGAVLSDLPARRGRVTGTEPVDAEHPSSRSLIRADVPSIELVRYAAVLRSLTAGTGTFTRAYRRHEPAPPSIADSLLAR